MESSKTWPVSGRASHRVPGATGQWTAWRRLLAGCASARRLPVLKHGPRSREVEQPQNHPGEVEHRARLRTMRSTLSRLVSGSALVVPGMERRTVGQGLSTRRSIDRSSGESMEPKGEQGQSEQTPDPRGRRNA